MNSSSSQYSLDRTTQDEIYQRMVQFRRHMHQNPELSLKEFNTSKFIIDTLQVAGFQEIHTQIGITGVIAVLRGQVDESILLRADMDALPLLEETDLPFKSLIDGVMHACGHDGHVAMLLGTAIVILEKVKNGLILNKGIKFCFQPGEEGSNGAALMIQDKSQYDTLETSPRVTNCFALHIASGLEANCCSYNVGPCSAYSFKFEISIKGKGGHAMSPEETIDALQVGTMIVVALYQIRGRNIDQSQPCAISVGTFNAGNAYNIISDKAQISGSVRTSRIEDKSAIVERIQKLCDGAQSQYDCQVQLIVSEGYRAVINDPSLETAIVSALKRVTEFKEGTSGLNGEDFFNFSEARPSAYYRIGAALPGSLVNNSNQHPHHSPKFDFDEKALLTGMKTWISVVEEFQK